jgi:hypothetical protein
VSLTSDRFVDHASGAAVAQDPGDAMGRYPALGWTVVCATALFLPLLFPLLTGRVFTKDDFAAMHLPFRYLYRNALRSGDSFLWTSVYHSGFYLHGEGEAGMTHPLHLVLYRFLPLGPAFNLEMLSTYIAMLAGTGLLLRRFGLVREAAWFGAIVFTFSGFNLYNVMHMNHIAAVAHMPWLLLATHFLLTSFDRRGRAFAFGGVAIVLGSQLLVGNPQYVWLTGIALAFMTGCLWYAGAPASRVGLLIVALALGALLGAAQLLPTLDFARESTRMTWSDADGLSFSLSPLNLVQLWSPFAFRFRVHAPEAESQIVHEFIVYNGAFCTLALAWLAMRWRQQIRPGLLAAFGALAVISFVLAMGRYGGVYPWLAHLPGLHNFRAPARHIVLFHLAMSGIAAVVFEDLVGVMQRGATELPRMWLLAVPVAMSLSTTVLAALLVRSSWAQVHGLLFSDFVRAAPWSVLMVLMAGLIVLAARGTRWALPALIVLVALDQGVWGYSYAYRWGPLERIDDLIAHADVPAESQPGDLIAPATVGGTANVAVLRGVRLTPGYSGLVASSFLDPADPVAQRIAGVVWRAAGTSWERVANTMPRARLVSTIQSSSDVRADVRAVDISTVALVDRFVSGVSGPAGSVRVLNDRPGLIVLETSAPSRQLLLVTERFHSGWRVTEDDAPTDAVRVYGDFLGCVVEAGRHRVTFTFAPASARRGIQLSFLGLSLTVALTALVGFQRQRRDRLASRVSVFP